MSRISDLPTVAAVADDDLIYVVDASDTTDDPAGSSKAITVADFKKTTTVVQSAHFRGTGTPALLWSSEPGWSIVRDSPGDPAGDYIITMPSAAPDADSQSLHVMLVNNNDINKIHPEVEQLTTLDFSLQIEDVNNDNFDCDFMVIRVVPVP